MAVSRSRLIGLYIAAVATPGCLLFTATLSSALGVVASGGVLVWLLPALTVVGEMRPARVRFRGGEISVTTSTTFTFALLLVAGMPTAVAVQGIASAISDLRQRVPLHKTAFNVAQYSIAFAAAGVVVAVVAPGGPLLASPRDVTVLDLVPLVVGGAAVLVVNIALISVAVALSQGRAMLSTLRRDFVTHSPMTAAMLLFAPVLTVVGQHGLPLVPLLLLMVLALYASMARGAEEEHAALHDPLTGLPNRRLLRRRVEEAVETRSAGETVAVLLVDLDRFKPINDALGHHIGDLVLQRVGKRLTDALTGAEAVARLGGDEFAAVLTGLQGPAAAREAAQAVVEAVGAPLVLEGFRVDVGASVGVALAPQHGESVEELLQHADVAMYAAKRATGGQQVFEADRDAQGRGRLELLGQLRQAIDGEQLVVHWQPLADLGSDGIDSAEALVRWQHPHHGLIYPDEFVPLAEQSELIGSLTRYVLDRALEQCSRWHADGMPLRVAVNLSAQSLADSEFPAQVNRLLRKWDVAPPWLKLEITEHTVMADPAGASRVLGELSAMGVQLAIDDFGTGYSSLVHLQQLPIDEIKIDKSFLFGLRRSLDDDRDDALVPAIITFARQLGLRIVAEGVESAAVWRWLHAHGCDLAQGYYLSEPTDGSTLTTWLRRRLTVGSVDVTAALRRAAPPLLHLVPPPTAATPAREADATSCTTTGPTLHPLVSGG